MNKKIVIPSIIFLFIFGFILLMVSESSFDRFLFEQLPYNYTTSVLMPSNSTQTASLGGFFNVYGHGNDFNFNITLPGQDIADPLEYSSNGIVGTGKIENMDISFDSIKNIFMLNLVDAVFDTKLSGVFNMSSDASIDPWTGKGTFNNTGKDFMGNFTINGTVTDYIGSYSIKDINKRIAIISDYNYWPVKDTTNITHVHNVIYL